MSCCIRLKYEKTKAQLLFTPSNYSYKNTEMGIIHTYKQTIYWIHLMYIYTHICKCKSIDVTILSDINDL